jgi:hypothetical protein
VAQEQDCIVCAGAHDPLIDQATFDAAQRQLALNQDNYSAPRPGIKGNVWPLAGQLTCGHCGKPVWTLPFSDSRGKRRQDYLQHARVCCSARRQHKTCPLSGMLPFLEILERVIDLLKVKLADPDAVAEMEKALQRQLRAHAQAGKVDRPRLVRRLAELDGKISEAVANLAHTPADLRADVAEYVRKLKSDRDERGQELRDLDARQRSEAPIEVIELRQTLDMVKSLSPSWQTREEAELLRAALRDLIAEVRIHFRNRTKSDPKPPRGLAPKRVLGRLEVELTPSFADLINMETRNSKSPQT